MPTHYQGSQKEVRALDAYLKLVRATETLGAQLQQALQGQGLTPGQLAVLEVLHHLGPMNQRQLGKKLLRSDANVTTVLDNLERGALVKRQRSDEDRRVVNVSLTREGRRLITRAFPTHARRIAELLGTLSTEEQDQLGRLCKKLGIGAGS